MQRVFYCQFVCDPSEQKGLSSNRGCSEVAARNVLGGGNHYCQPDKLFEERRLRENIVFGFAKLTNFCEDDARENVVFRFCQLDKKYFHFSRKPWEKVVMI